MSKLQKLKEVIKYAVERGLNSEVPDKIEKAKDVTHFGLLIFWHGDQLLYYSELDILLDHDLAKAVFGEEDMKFANDKENIFKGQFKEWQYHLQQIVLLKPEKIIDYYYKYVKEK